VLGWVLAAVAAGWTALALAVGVVIGRVIRLRERQVPERDRPVRGVPAPRSAPDAAADRDRERG
jgi:hypothetical protein